MTRWQKTIGFAVTSSLVSFGNAFIALLQTLPPEAEYTDVPQIPLIIAGVGAAVSGVVAIGALFTDKGE
jgi:hypothetical protein